IALFLAIQSDGPRKIYGTEAPPQRLKLRASAGLDEYAIAQLLGCRVSLGKPVDCLVVPRALLDAPLPLAQDWLREQVRPQFEAMLALAKARRVVTISVRGELDRRLSQGAGTELAEVAATLKVSPRTLRARLAEEQTAFSMELDAVRKEFSLRHLAD